MKQYFNNPTDLQELRKQYKELLKCYHPDNGGDVADMQEINVEYEKLFKILKDRHEQTTDSNQSEYSKNMYDWENDIALREVLQKIINLADITIEVCGSWLWMFGNTYQHKELLKEIGFKYAGKKKAWYYHTEAFRKKGRKSLSMDDIRNYYGSTEVQTERQVLLKQA